MSTDISIDLDSVLKNISENVPIPKATQEKAVEVSKEIREEIKQVHGEMEIAVQLVREAREE